MKRIAKKSVYNGVEFDSMLERRAYMLLEMMNIEFTFHEDTFTLQKKYTVDAYSQKTKKIYKSSVQPITYTPEFTIKAPGNITIYIEMKGFVEGPFRLKWKLFKAQLKSNEKAFLVKSNGDLVNILNIYDVKREANIQKIQQQFDL